MFQIRELEMVHWDFWRAIRVPLDAQIVTIVGPNGSGKTTLLDALRTLLALKCSGRRDYKRYVRNNRESYAWLRGVVSNPRRSGGGLFPSLFFPITSEEVTLFCRIRKQGGDWVRQYAIAEGNVALDADTESRLQWIGVNEYKRRLEQAGLTMAIAEVLALEQGDTDKLCEYSPKALLDLVFQVFGDKQVLDHYAEAKLRLKETEAELGRMRQQLSQVGVDVERLRLRANNHLEWRALQDEVARLVNEVGPALRYIERWESLRGYIAQFRGARRQLRERQEALARLDRDFHDTAQALAALERQEADARLRRQLAFENFQTHRDRARDTEKLLDEEKKLRQLAESEHGADALALSDQLARCRAEMDTLRTRIRELKLERQTLSEAQFALQQGRQPQPDFVRQMRAALDEAGVAHQILTDIVEVRDPRWQAAVEALLAPYRHIILLQREADRQRAWEVGQRLRYRHFIVAEREAVGTVQRQSVLEIVDLRAPAPGWLIGLLNRTQRVASVADGQRCDGDWITPDGFHRERRGARDISVRAGDYAFGEAARQSQLNEISHRLRDINQSLLHDETRLAEHEAEASRLNQSLMGMQAVVQLAARQEAFAAAAARWPALQAAAADAGAALAETDQQQEALRTRLADLRSEHRSLQQRRAELDSQVSQQLDQVMRQREEQSRQIRSLREAKAALPKAFPDAAALRAVRERYGSVREVEHLIAQERARLEQGDWETDATVLARRDRLAQELDRLERDVLRHEHEVGRTRELTDDARAAYINKLRATVRTYARNLRHLGELAGIAVEVQPPQLENDDLSLAQAGLEVCFNFDQKGLMGLNDGEASGGQQVMKSLILLIGLMMDDANPAGFVFIDEPFAHLDIFNIDRVGAFLKATQAQYLITTPLTHNTNVYGPAELTLLTRKKQPGEIWAPLIAQTRRRVRPIAESA
jgi:chromosome segregation ATPase